MAISLDEQKIIEQAELTVKALNGLYGHMQKRIAKWEKNIKNLPGKVLSFMINQIGNPLNDFFGKVTDATFESLSGERDIKKIYIDLAILADKKLSETEAMLTSTKNKHYAKGNCPTQEDRDKFSDKIDAVAHVVASDLIKQNIEGNIVVAQNAAKNPQKLMCPLNEADNAELNNIVTKSNTNPTAMAA